eukprot:1777330-Pyramimonas_sp.AAC.2
MSLFMFALDYILLIKHRGTKPVARPTLVKPTGSRMVWRDGQKKRVFVYRFLSTGTLEEKVFQRQLSKEGLKSAVSADADGVEL